MALNLRSLVVAAALTLVGGTAFAADLNCPPPVKASVRINLAPVAHRPVVVERKVVVAHHPAPAAWHAPHSSRTAALARREAIEHRIHALEHRVVNVVHHPFQR